MRGGKRDGAGRKLGSVARIDYEARQKALTTGQTPLDYILKILRDDTQDARTRLDAAKALLPYCHARITPSEMAQTPYDDADGPQLPSRFNP